MTVCNNHFLLSFMYLYTKVIPKSFYYTKSMVQTKYFYNDTGKLDASCTETRALDQPSVITMFYDSYFLYYMVPRFPNCLFRISSFLYIM